MNKLLLILLSSILAIILTGCGGIKINTQVLVKDSNYSFTTDTGAYTYQLVLEPKTGTTSSTTLGITTKKSKLVVYREDLPLETFLLPGTPPKPVRKKIQSFEIKPGAKYSQEDSPNEGKTKFEITMDITMDTEKSSIKNTETEVYLVDFQVKKQT